MFTKPVLIRLIASLIFVSFGAVAVATESIAPRPSTDLNGSVKLPGCDIEFRDEMGGKQAIGPLDPTISPPSIEVQRSLKGSIFTFRLSCEKSSGQIDKKKNMQTSGLTEIGVKLSNGRWTRAIDGRYYANLKSARWIKGKNWVGVLSYVEGWEGDGQNTGDRTLGFCVAPDYRVCGVATGSGDGGNDNARHTLTPRGIRIITNIYEGTFIRHE
jgi:hypothetical protein